MSVMSISDDYLVKYTKKLIHKMKNVGINYFLSGLNSDDFKNGFELNYKINKRKKLVEDILNCGAVFCGSKLLYKTSIHNKKFLNRKPSDWDFIVTEPILYKITSEVLILNKKGNGVYTHNLIDGGVYGHGSSDIDIILVDELPKDLHDFKGQMWSNPLDTYLAKIDLYEKNISRWKHLSDIRYFYYTFAQEYNTYNLIENCL